jgi:soluble lytic murein transglycosylase-like protein
LKTIFRYLLAGAGIVLLFPLSFSRSSSYALPETPPRLFSFYPAPDWVYQFFPQAIVPYGVHIKAVARKYNVDPHLVAALIAAESGFDATAVSPKGAVGLMQVVPIDPAEWDRLLDPMYNLTTGVAHLKYLLEFFGGDLSVSLAAYNCGLGRMRNGARIPEKGETRLFLRNVLDFYYLLWSDSPGPGFPFNVRHKDQAGVPR